MAVTIMDVVIFVTFFLLALYYYGVKTYDHFKNTDVKHFKPTLPFVGTFSSMIFKREEIYELIRRIYNTYPDEKYVGIFEGPKPMILLRDLDLIKRVVVENFDSFHDRRNFIAESTDDIITHILFLMQGKKWREMRGALSPAFTSSKMRNMFIFMEECAKDTIEFFKNHKDMKDKNIVEIEVKDTTVRYTHDVIANAIFGVRVNSLADRNNDVFKLAQASYNNSGLQMLKVFCLIFFPRLAKLLKLQFTSQTITDCFKKLINETIENREKTGLVRQDMINLLMHAKNGTLVHDFNTEVKDTGFATVEESNIGMQETRKKWTDIELAAQAYLFYIVGLDTTSSALMFLMYELMRNQDVQKKLHESIDEHLKKSDGNVNYTDILGLKYLDMCISESLRIWSIPLIDRVCYKSFNLPPPNDQTTKTYEIKKGQLVWIPISGITRDPKYFPNPEKFDPERFSDENKSSIDAMTYLPFGIGPRNCIASRFALLKMKVFMFHLLSKFDIVPVETTQIPLKLKKSFLQVQPEKDLRVGLKLRNNIN